MPEPSVSTSGEEGICVAIRMRPLNNSEGQHRRVWRVLPNLSSVTQTTVDGEPLPERVNGRTYFTYDKTYGENTSTREVYNSIAKNIVSSVVNGLNGTIFAYGQTSSGKTYTMQGSGTIAEGSVDNGGGIVHMAAADIFRHIRETTGRVFLVRVSFLEIYNEEVRDLLDPHGAKSLSIREDPHRGVFVPSHEEIVTDMEMLLQVLFQGDKSRAFAATAMNERSSRSHTIFRVTIESRERRQTESDDEDQESDGEDGRESNGSGAVLISTLNLVDLAGSESVRHTGATGDRLKEGAKINQSLLTLSRVIVALGSSNRSTHVNFRDSKLTRILQPSLEGNARMSIVCCATPSELYLEETRSTLAFAARAKLVKTNAKVNEVLDDRSLIRRLQKELAEARKEAGKTADQAHLQALQEKAVSAHTAAKVAEDKLRRIQTSLINSAVWISKSRPASIPQETQFRKRRHSDGEPFRPLSPETRLDPDKRLPMTTTPGRKKMRIREPTPEKPTVAESDLLRLALKSKAVKAKTVEEQLEQVKELLNKKEKEIEILKQENDSIRKENDIQREVEKQKVEHLCKTYSSEIEELKSQLDDSSSQLKQFECDMKTVISERDRSVSENERLAAVIESLQNENCNLSTEVATHTEKVRELQRLHEITKSNLEVQHDENVELARELQGAQSKLSRMDEVLKGALNERKSLSSQVDELTQGLGSKSAELKAALEELCNYRSQCESLKTRLLTIESQHDEAVQNRDHLLEENIAAKQGQAVIQKEADALLDELAKCKDALKVETEKHCKTMEKSTAAATQAEDLKNELSKVSNKFSAANKELETIAAEKYQIVGLLEDRERRLKDACASIEVAQQQNKELLNNENIMKEGMQKIHSENSVLQSCITELLNKVQQTESQLAESQQNYEELRRRTDTLQDSLKLSDHERHELSTSISSVSAEAEKTKLELERVTKLLAERQHDVEMAEAEKLKLESIVAETDLKLRSSQESLADASEKISSFEVELLRTKKERDELHERIDQMTLRLQENEAKFQQKEVDLVAQSELLQTRLDQVEQEKRELLAGYSAASTEAEEARANLERVTKLLAKAEQKIATEEAEKLRLERIVSETDLNLRSSQESLAEASEKISSFEVELLRTKKERDELHERIDRILQEHEVKRAEFEEKELNFVAQSELLQTRLEKVEQEKRELTACFSTASAEAEEARTELELVHKRLVEAEQNIATEEAQKLRLEGVVAETDLKLRNSQESLAEATEKISSFELKLLRSNDQMSSQLQEYEAKRAEFEQREIELVSQSELLQTRLEQVEQEKRELLAGYSAASAEAGEARAELERVHNRLVEVERNIATEEAENLRLEGIVAETDLKLRSSQESLAEASEKISLFEIELLRSKTERDELHERIDQMSLQLQEHDVKGAELVAQSGLLQTKLDEVEQEKRELSACYLAASSEAEKAKLELERVTKHFGETKQSIATEAAEKLRLEGIVAETDLKLRSSQESLAEATEKISSFEVELLRSTKERDALRERADQMSLRLQEHEAKRAEFEEKELNFVAQSELLQTRSEQVEQEKRELSACVATEEAEKLRLEGIVAESDVKLRSSQESLAEASEKISSFEVNLLRTQQERDALQERADQMSLQLQEHEAKRAEFEEKELNFVAQSELLQTRLEQVEQEKRELSACVATEEAEKLRLEGIVAESDLKLRSSQESLAEASEKISSFEVNLLRNQQERDALQERADQMSLQLQEHEAKRAEFEEKELNFVAQSDLLQTRLEQVEQEKRELSACVATEEAEKLRLEGIVAETDLKLRSSQESLAEASEKISSFEVELLRTTKERDALRERADQMSLRLQEHEAKRAEFEEKELNFVAQSELLQMRLKQVEQEKRELSACVVTEVAEKLRLEGTVAETDLKLRSSQESLAESSEKISSFEVNLLQTEQERDALQERAGQMSLQLQEHEAKRAEFEQREVDLVSQSELLQTRLEQVEQEKRELSACYSASSAEAETARVELERVTKLLAERQHDVEMGEAEKLRLEGIVAETDLKLRSSQESLAKASEKTSFYEIELLRTKKEIDALQKRVDQMSSQLQEHEAKRAEFEQRDLELVSQTEMLQTKLEQVEQENRELSACFSAESAEVEKARFELERVYKLLAKAQQDVETEAAEKLRLKDIIVETDLKLASSQETLAEATENISSFEVELLRSKKERDELDERIDQMSSQLQEHEAKRAEFEQREVDLVSQSELLQTRLEQVEQEKRELSASFSAVSAEAEKTRFELERVTKLLAKAQQDVETEAAEKLRLEGVVAETDLKLRNSQESLAEATENISFFEVESLRSKKERDAMSSQLQEHEAKRAEFEQREVDLVSQSELLQTKLKQVEKEKRELSACFSAASAEAGEAREELADTKLQLSRRVEELGHLVEMNEDTKKRLDSLNAERASSTAKMSTLEKEHLQLLSELELSISSLEEKSRFNLEISTENKRLLETLEKCKNEASEARNELKNAEEKLVVAGNFTASLKGEVARLKGEIAQAAGKLASSQAECKDRADELISLHDLLEASNRSLTELKQSKASVDEEFRTREKELIESVSRLSKENADLRQHLNDTRDNLRDSLEEKESSSKRAQQSQRDAELRLESISKDNQNLRTELQSSEARLLEAKQAAAAALQERDATAALLRCAEENLRSYQSANEKTACSLPSSSTLDDQLKVLKDAAEKSKSLKDEAENKLAQKEKEFEEEKRAIFKEVDEEIRHLKESHLNALRKSESDAYAAREMISDLQDERDYNVEKVRELENQITALQNEFSRMQRCARRQEKEKETHIENMKSDLKRLQADFDIASRKTLEYGEILRDAEYKLEKSRKEIIAKDKEINAMQEMIKRLDSEREATNSSSAVSEADKLRVTTESLLHELAAKDERIQKLEKMKLTKDRVDLFKKMKKENEEYKTKLEAAEQKIAEVFNRSATRTEEDQTEIASVRFAKEALEKKVRKYAAHCQRLEDEKSDIRRALMSSKVDTVDEHDIAGSVVALSDRITSLEQQLSQGLCERPEAEELRRKNDQLRNEMDELKQRAEKAFHSEAETRRSLYSIQKEKQKLTDYIDSVRNEAEDRIKENVGKIQYLEQENLKLMTDLKDLKRNIQNLRAENNSLRSQQNIDDKTNSTLASSEHSFKSLNRSQKATTDYDKTISSNYSPISQRTSTLDKENRSNFSPRAKAFSKENNTGSPRSSKKAPLSSKWSTRRKTQTPGLGEALEPNEENTQECQQS
ncbi:hypothetical protein ACA910_013188 [Epithemia clementina (nom. ined.)]